jgi:hypothetical protein
MNDSPTRAAGLGDGGNGVLRWLRVGPVVDAMNQGATLRKTLSILVQLGAVLIGLRLFVGWCRMWPAIKGMQFVEGLGFALFLLGLLYGGFLALEAMFLRGGTIRELPESDYAVSPIVGLLAAMVGEMAFVFLGVMSVPAMVGVWCGTMAIPPLPLLWQWQGDNTFLNGISMFLSCWLTGLFALVVTRWLKEWTLAVIQIAQDVHVIRGK